jgi:CheY-like chemotaxis protein
MARKQTRILLVDDYRVALEGWAWYLRTRGYEVLTAGDGLKAVEIAAQFLPDLIILDLDLPGITGVETARRLRDLSMTAEIPLIAATGESHATLLDEARGAGFAAVLLKPCEPAAFVKAIERVLGTALNTDAAGRAR